jgi:hypothetical protein
VTVEQVEIGTAVAEVDAEEHQQGGVVVAVRPMELPDVQRMMDAAIEHGKDGVEALEKLVELQMRILDRHAETALVTALSEFKKACPPIRKTRKVDYTTKTGVRVKFEFAELEGIQNTIDPVLHRFGLSYTFDTVGGERSIKTTCRVQHIDGAFRESSVTLPVSGPQDSPAQQYGGTMTYGKRYSLAAAFGLVIEDDVDGLQPGVGEPITKAQVAELTKLSNDVGMTSALHTRLLKLLGVDSFAALPASHFETAKRHIEAVRK